MITENITTRVGVMTMMFFIIYVLIKPVVLGESLGKHQIIILPLLFFIWLGGSVMLSSILSSPSSPSMSSLTIPINSIFIYLTILYVIVIAILLFLRSNYQSLLILSGVYLAFALISIYL